MHHTTYPHPFLDRCSCPACRAYREAPPPEPEPSNVAIVIGLVLLAGFLALLVAIVVSEWAGAGFGG